MRTDRAFAAEQLTKEIGSMNEHAFLCKDFQNTLQGMQKSDGNFIKEAKLDAICRMTPLNEPSAPVQTALDGPQMNIAPLVAVGVGMLVLKVAATILNKGSLGDIATLLAQNLPSLIPGAGPYVEAATLAFQTIQGARGTPAQSSMPPDSLVANTASEFSLADNANFSAEAHPVVTHKEMNKILETLQSFGTSNTLSLQTEASLDKPSEVRQVSVPKCPSKDEIQSLLRGRAVP